MLKSNCFSNRVTHTLCCCIVSFLSGSTSLASAESPATSNPATQAEQTVTLALENADIRDLINWAQSITHKNIIIHPNVKGKITVLAGQSLNREEAYQVFLSALQVHGFAAIESEHTVKIVPDSQAKHSAIPVLSEDSNKDNNTEGAQVKAEEVVVYIVKVNNIAASQLISLLRPLIPQGAHLAAYPATNTLIVADRANNIDKILRIIERLDRVGVVDIELLALQFSNAKEVVDVINRLIPKPKGKAGEGQQLQLAVDERSNSVLVTGEPASRQQIRQLIKRLDQPLAGEGNTQVFYLNYANAIELVPILESISGTVQQNRKDQGKAGSQVSIQANESLNALVITAPPSVLSTIKAVIAKLDKRRAQVLVEAIIVEVNEDLGNNFGVEWRTNNGDGGFAGFRSFQDLAPLSAGSDGGISLGSGLSLGYFKAGKLRALINALATQANANVLSTPTIMALDNEEASILVGENVPFITGSEARDNDDPFQTIERKDVGISLKIKPRVNNDNSVTLDIEQSVESISKSDAVASDIITNKREIKTRVLIENGEILVLGGLIRDELQETENKVPLLGDLPGIGRLFKSTSTTTVKRNLMVFIRPTILRDSKSGSAASRDRYNNIQGMQDAFSENVEHYFAPRAMPRLPELATNQGVTP